VNAATLETMLRVVSWVLGACIFERCGSGRGVMVQVLCGAERGAAAAHLLLLLPARGRLAGGGKVELSPGWA
jgi:hypothetical protein